MTEIHVNPNGTDFSAVLLIILTVVIVAVLGFFAYRAGWFTMTPATPSTSNINLTIPTPTPGGY